MQASQDLFVEPVGLDLDMLPRPLRWSELFGNNHPVELEIGTGKGTFLTDQACARPDVNFFGIEWARWFWRYASDRLRRNHCERNARMIRADAAFFFAEFVVENSLSVIHIYFPDPWPKKRHNKRRLIQEPFLKLVHKSLVPGGRLQIVTDHKDYFEQIQAVVGSSALQVIEYSRPQSASEGEFVGTNFERKYRREGRPFYAVAAVKAARDAETGAPRDEVLAMKPV